MGFADFSALVLSECENTWTFSVNLSEYSVNPGHVMLLHNASHTARKP